MIRKLNTAQDTFAADLENLIALEFSYDKKLRDAVDDILLNVKNHGDDAVIEYTNNFDARNIKSIDEILVPQERLKQSFNSLDSKQKEALIIAKERIQKYHSQQRIKDWQMTDNTGVMFGQKVTPLSRVGMYVPGGKAAYPSTVLMNAMPAKVAGVPELIMVVPTPRGVINEVVFAAAYLCEINTVLTIGGAQAIAALAYGTKFIPQVDKIVGPGNSYVTQAKKVVFGKVGIDMIAGPSEIVVICDGNVNPDWAAMDLFSQAEHDEDAQAILLTDNKEFLAKLEQSMAKILPTLQRRDVIAKSLNNRGALILTKSLDEAFAISNKIAPEHLSLLIKNPQKMINNVINAGAIFMGNNTCEVLGDYCAGPNHVLPTSGTARFSSALAVDDFIKKSSVVMIGENGANNLFKVASVLARTEGLDAHAQAANLRIKK